MVDPADYISSWPSSDGFWTAVESGSAIPGIKIVKLMSAIFGGIGLAVTYWIIGPIRQLSVYLEKEVRDVQIWANTLADKVTNIPGESFKRAATEAATAVGHEGILGFILAFALAMATAMTFWVAIRVIR